jgi:hypothetical protein
MIVVTFQNAVSAAWFRCYRTFRYVTVVLIGLLVEVSTPKYVYISITQNFLRLFYILFHQ